MDPERDIIINEEIKRRMVTEVEGYTGLPRRENTCIVCPCQKKTSQPSDSNNYRINQYKKKKEMNFQTNGRKNMYGGNG